MVWDTPGTQAEGIAPLAICTGFEGNSLWIFVRLPSIFNRWEENIWSYSWAKSLLIEKVTAQLDLLSSSSKLDMLCEAVLETRICSAFLTAKKLVNEAYWCYFFAAPATAGTTDYFEGAGLTGIMSESMPRDLSGVSSCYCFSWAELSILKFCRIMSKIIKRSISSAVISSSSSSSS